MNSAHKLDLTNFDKDFHETLQDVVCYAAWYSYFVQSRDRRISVLNDAIEVEGHGGWGL